MNKWLALIISLVLFVVDYYILCWVLKISYCDILGGFFKNKSRWSVFAKFIP